MQTLLAKLSFMMSEVLPTNRLRRSCPPVKDYPLYPASRCASRYPMLSLPYKAISDASRPCISRAANSRAVSLLPASASHHYTQANTDFEGIRLLVTRTLSVRVEAI